jgi:predicted nucleic acid-binding protein
MVVGELALGSIRDRAAFLHLLGSLRQTRLATHAEVLGLIETRTLHGRGLSLVDAHLLAAALLTPTVLWTRDKRLHRVAAGLECAWSVSAPKRRR